ncbi:hypothetical protein ACHAXA_000057 [Cyclostephanos tholiformis]|uniref:Plastid lipid-associated protein/fibrillin conserved domain-containing protein n=1 Tax=Cyclostephanos tholiformis TaxID=382380 RepID=A0ABD3SS24_9STRA
MCYFAINVGVRGGEIDAKSRTPQKLDYYSISTDAGRAADVVIETAEKLAALNPTEELTLFLGDLERGKLSPLDGEWKFLFATAADLTFGKNSARGHAKVKNVVDASRGRIIRITNVVDFAPYHVVGDDTIVEEPALRRLSIVIAAKAVGKSRLDMRFRCARADLTKFFSWKRRWSLYIPVPAPFIRVIVLISRIFRFGGETEKVISKAYFGVLYLDNQLRIHRTGEDNLFVQVKEDAWSEARLLLV